MHTDYRLDLSSPEQQVVVTVSAPEPFEDDVAELLDSYFSNTAAVVNAQGFSDENTDAAMSVIPPRESSAGRTRRYELVLRLAHPSVWRTLSGLCHRFSIASHPLDRVQFVAASQSARSYTDQDILRLPYVAARPVSGFELDRTESPGENASVEVELRPKMKKPVVEQLTSTLNAWLELSTGGFFKDNEDPVSNAHDCPGIQNVGGRLLVARCDMWAGSESAFDVVVNVADHYHRQFGCIKSVRIY